MESSRLAHVHMPLHKKMNTKLQYHQSCSSDRPHSQSHRSRPPESPARWDPCSFRSPRSDPQTHACSQWLQEPPGGCCRTSAYKTGREVLLCACRYHYGWASCGSCKIGAPSHSTEPTHLFQLHYFLRPSPA